MHFSVASIIQSYIEAGVFVSGFFILNEILYYNKKKKIGFHLFLSLIVFLSQTKICFLLQHSNLPSPWFFFTSITILFMIGPIQYSQTLRMLDKFTFKEFTKHYSIIFLTIPIEILLIINFPEHIPEVGIQKMSVIIISLLGLMHYFIYFHYNQKLFNDLVKSYKVEHYQDVYKYNWMIAFLVSFGCSCLILSYKILFQLEGILVTTGGFVAIFYLFRYPDFFDTISQEVARQKYEKTSISDLDLEKLKKQLESLMIEKKYYQDDQIYIDDIANELMVNKNQLSRILNETYNKNFYQFINYYRILEAKELLTKNPDQTILDIAYEVGFKSKSAFYKNFFELTNLTPQDYRKKNKT